MTATLLFTKSQSGISTTNPIKNHETTDSTAAPARTLVVLHGLFGNWENWGARIRQYSKYSDVHAMDLRNHGESPHLNSASYSEMADDVIKTLDHLQITDCDLLGHSMGGKVAMRIASIQPTRIARLILVDIAPKAYPPHHQSIIDALYAIDTAKLNSRRDADQQLADVVDDPSTRAFLLKNLVRDNKDSGQNNPSGTGFRWQFNLAGIRDSYPQLTDAPELELPYDGPTLFIKGADSDYLSESDRDTVMRSFPNAKVKIIGGAGHWPHAEKPELFDRIVAQFLEYGETEENA